MAMGLQGAGMYVGVMCRGLRTKQGELRAQLGMAFSQRGALCVLAACLALLACVHLTWA